MRISFIPLVGAILAVGACNYKPMVEPSEPITNFQLKSVNHWQQLAAQTADQLTAALRNTPTMASRPLYVAGDRSSEFVRGFRDFLATELANRGFSVATSPSPDAVIINTSTQVVAMSDPRKPPIPLGAIEVGIAAAIEVTTGLVTYLTDSPDTEVVVSTTVLDDQRFLFRKNSIFYVDDREAEAYRSGPSNMITNTQSAPAVLRVVPVSSD
jgi:hypothetical protein